MSALSDLVNLLSRSRDGVLPSMQTFAPLDIDAISNELKLEHHGKTNGSRNKPSADTDMEDSVEGDILAEIQRRAWKAGEEYRSQLELYDGRIRQALLATDQRVAIEAAGEGALTDFKVQASDDLDHLFSARAEVEGREQEFEAYRTARRVKRLPHITTPGQQTVRVLILAIIVVMESMLNGMFFAQGSEGGIIGGITQAFLLALFNVGSAVLFAKYILPLWRTRRDPTLFVIFTMMYGMWVLGLNLFIGHFRDRYIEHAGNVPLAELMNGLVTNPAGLQDAASLLLVMLGVGLNIVSVLDAASMQDPDPEYGAIGRRRAEAMTAYAHQKARCLAGLTERRDEATEGFSAAIEAMRTAGFDLRLAIEGRARLHQNYIAYLTHVHETYVRLLGRYRDANSRARTLPPPERFGRRPLRPEFLNEPALSAQSNSGEEDRAKAIERMAFYVKAINAQFETEVRRYQTIAGLTGPVDTTHATA
jgi:hypothetical protein